MPSRINFTQDKSEIKIFFFTLIALIAYAGASSAYAQPFSSGFTPPILVTYEIVEGESAQTVCGNNVCETGETCSSCEADCGACETSNNQDSGDNSGGGSGGGGGSETGTEGYKAVIQSVTIDPLKINTANTITLKIGHGIPTGQAFAIVVTVINSEKKLVFLDHADTPILSSGRSYNISFPKKWVATEGTYEVTASIYAKNKTTKFDEKRKTITITSDGSVKQSDNVDTNAVIEIPETNPITIQPIVPEPEEKEESQFDWPTLAAITAISGLIFGIGFVWWLKRREARES